MSDKTVRLVGTVTKADDEQQILAGWASCAVTREGQRVKDSQNDVLTAELLQKAQWRFMAKGGVSGTDHSGDPDALIVGAVTFTKETQRAMGVPDGVLPEAMWIEVFVPSKEAYLERKATRRAFSLEGRASRRKVK